MLTERQFAPELGVGYSNSRRGFLRQAGAAAAGLTLGLTRIGHAETGGMKGKKETAEEEVSPMEDLMREHGLLNRMLLIYEEWLRRAANEKPGLNPELLRDCADLMRRFIEDYHEKLEENYLFPRFEKASQHVDLVKVLRQQHDAGRRLTERILQLSTSPALKNPTERGQLIDAIRQFVRMYRPHEAREDTVLFPALRRVVTPQEYDTMGEEFEEQEHRLFGERGFEGIVEKVASIEKAVGIYDLAQFTPQ